MRSLVFALCLLLIVPACGSVPATRETPEGTVEMFKVLHRKGDRAGEWDILSPSFKRRLSQRAGRNVDVADFEAVIETMRTDPKVRLAETLLQTATVTNQTMIDDSTAKVTIRAGGPLGKSATITMRKLTKWQLAIIGDPQPYWGIVGDSDIGVERGADGGYTVWTGGGEGWRQTFAASEVESYTVASQWYVDDLGDLETSMMGSM